MSLGLAALMSVQVTSGGVTAARPVSTISTRDRIVETALRLFSEKGTAAVSMRELADDAGVTVPGLYYHFASKADLIREVYRAQVARADGAQPRSPIPAPCSRSSSRRAQREFERMVSEREFLRLMHLHRCTATPTRRRPAPSSRRRTASTGWRCSSAPPTSARRRSRRRRRRHRHLSLGPVPQVPQPRRGRRQAAHPRLRRAAEPFACGEVRDGRRPVIADEPRRPHAVRAVACRSAVAC